MICKAAVVALLGLIPCLSTAQILTICDVLSRLTDLNGKEIQVRGAWFSGDMGSELRASPDCDHPVIRDRWIWKNSIEIAPVKMDLDTVRHFLPLYTEKKKLQEQNPSGMVIVTFTGVIHTRDHFKLNPYSHLPLGFGYSVAELLFSGADNLAIVPLSSTEKARFLKDAEFPAPTKWRRN